MKIGIIGAGNIGGSSRGGCGRSGTRSPSPTRAARRRSPPSPRRRGRRRSPSPRRRAAGEVVVVTIPEQEIPSLPAGLFDGRPASVVVVDTGNYYPRNRDGRIDGIEDGLTESRWVERAARPAGGQGVQQHPRPEPDGTRQAGRHARADRAAGRRRRPGRQGGRAAAVDELGFDPSTRAGSTSRGASSPAPRSTAPTSTPRACDGPRRGRAGAQAGVARDGGRAGPVSRPSRPPQLAPPGRRAAS